MLAVTIKNSILKKNNKKLVTKKNAIYLKLTNQKKLLIYRFYLHLTLLEQTNRAYI